MPCSPNDSASAPAAKLRITLRPRKHPHIRDEFDPILLQERKEDVDPARRMSNRPNARNHFGSFAFMKFPVTFQSQLRNENEKITAVSNRRRHYMGAYARRRYANSTRGRISGSAF